MLAILGGTYGDGASSGKTRVTIDSLGNFDGRQSFRQFDVKAKASNTGQILIGDSTVSTTNAYVELAAGESWGLNPASYTAPAGQDFEINLAQVYIVGTTVADQAFIVALA